MAYPSRKRTSKSELGYKFISLFERMPGNVYCPRFFILHHSVGCPYQCSYCFLQNTLRGNTEPRWYDNFDVMETEVQRWLKETTLPSLLNTGELADSFSVSTEYLKHVVPFFTAQEKHVIAFLTKGDTYPDELKPHKTIRLGWSINAPEIAARYEQGAPPALNRLAAADRAKKAGFQVRIRIDPVIPIEGWEKYYTDFIKLLADIKPDFVTIRTLRAQSNLMIWARKGHAKDKPNPFADVGHLMLRDGDDHANRINPELRLQVYQTLGKVLDECKIPWGLCKETTEVLTKLGKLNHMCNCLP
jgi:spore photoproduct lyase